MPVVGRGYQFVSSEALVLRSFLKRLTQRRDVRLENGFIEDNFIQVLSGKNRIVYQVRDDTVFIHLVVDTRRDLQALLQLDSKPQTPLG